jgi:hypothetical protein
MAVQKKDDTVYWFQGCLPVFHHHVDNKRLFQVFCCQMINLGVATASEIASALCVNREKLSRWARQEGSCKAPDSRLATPPRKKKHCFTAG